MNNRCGLNGASPHICTCKQSSRAMQGACVIACLWHLGIRNQGGHTNAQSLQQIYTQYLALILTIMLSTFTHSNSVADAKKLWIEAF